MTKVIQMRIPETGEMVYRYPECPYAGDVVQCAGKPWTGTLTEDHFCAFPGTKHGIACGFRHQKNYCACPYDYSVSKKTGRSDKCHP